MEHQDFVELVNSPLLAVDGTALASSASIGVISPSASTAPAWTLAANRWLIGGAIRVTAYGRVSTTGTPTLNVGLYSGGTGGVKLADTGAITTTSGVTNVPWKAEFVVVSRGIGTSGSLFCQGSVHGISGTVGVSVVPACSGSASAPAAVTVDTTAAKTLDLCATWGTSSPSNTITCHLFLIESLNFNAT